jgi:hypothetical protein
MKSSPTGVLDALLQHAPLGADVPVLCCGGVVRAVAEAFDGARLVHPLGDWSRGARRLLPACEAASGADGVPDGLYRASAASSDASGQRTAHYRLLAFPDPPVYLAVRSSAVFSDLAQRVWPATFTLVDAVVTLMRAVRLRSRGGGGEVAR